MAQNIPWIVLIFAVLNWLAVEKQWKLLEYVAKPGTMLALLYRMAVHGGLGGEMLWFSLGVIFSLAGDVFLMVPRNMFIFGLLAFLLAHVSYIIGLNSMPPYLGWQGGVAAVLLAVLVAWLYRRLSASLVTKGMAGLRVPVVVYMIVISLMVYSAVMTWSRPDWGSNPALLVTIGAMFFYLSDSILAWDRFVNPISHARLKTMVTYHLGQVLIILGALLRLNG